MFENHPEDVKGWLDKFPLINYLQDEQLTLYFDGPNGDMPENNIRIYGSPWQPWFYDWAFNLHRNSIGLASKWEAIPNNTDILITHSPPFGILDEVNHNSKHFGSPSLADAVMNRLKCKISTFGHIHSGHGTKKVDNTLFINANWLFRIYKFV